jgi:glutamyl-Q tRNA(Asp) synthetase
VDAHNPQPALAAALTFLGQRPPHELARGTVKELWGWALENWKLERVSRVPSARAPGEWVSSP